MGLWSNAPMGLILVDLGVPADEAARLVSGRVAVVSVGIQLAGASSVMVDDFAIGHDAVGHLTDLGHRRIALLEGVSGETQRFAVPEQRRFGYAAGLSAAGVDTREEYLVAGDHEFSAVVGLTTIQQQVIEYGAVAARLVLDHLLAPDFAPTLHVAETSLIQRATCGPPPG